VSNLQGGNETGPPDYVDRLCHGHGCRRTPGCINLGDLLAGNEDRETVQGNEDTPHERVTRIDGGSVRAKRSAGLTQDGTDDREGFPADVLLRREEIAALSS
jgi:hypothetical protein